MSTTMETWRRLIEATYRHRAKKDKHNLMMECFGYDFD
ncbi:hypothetical protein [Stenotrophomonas phage RAS14]